MIIQELPRTWSIRSAPVTASPRRSRISRCIIGRCQSWPKPRIAGEHGPPPSVEACPFSTPHLEPIWKQRSSHRHHSPPSTTKHARSPLIGRTGTPPRRIGSWCIPKSGVVIEHAPRNFASISCCSQRQMPCCEFNLHSSLPSLRFHFHWPLKIPPCVRRSPASPRFPCMRPI